MNVVAYPARPEYPVDFLNAHKIDRGYDLAAPATKTLGLRDLCNLLVHSFVFMPATDEEGTGWTGFFLNSDRTKKRELVFIARADFDHFVDEVIGDYVVTLHVNRIQNKVRKSRVGDGDAVARISLNAAETARS